ncbi:hypothetical protein BWI17_11775 [Betaproteobacteria bacterium GR16-43]|nr:hypothetical protein BWI17_11775 [Betaproteobacteria bacterium GR16-43]
MKFLPAALLFTATLISALPGFAQEPSLAEAERLVSALKRGMTSDDVRKLLGTPRRTAIRSDGNSSSEVTRGGLQWTYVWAGATGPGTLRIDFGQKYPETWIVTRWAWNGN